MTQATAMSVSVSQLISGIKALPEDTKRKMSAVIGAVVADAASLPLQWIYDDKEILSDKYGIHSRNLFYSHLYFSQYIFIFVWNIVIRK